MITRTLNKNTTQVVRVGNDIKLYLGILQNGKLAVKISAPREIPIRSQTFPIRGIESLIHSDSAALDVFTAESLQ